jgi:hypothetical protein
VSLICVAMGRNEKRNGRVGREGRSVVGRVHTASGATRAASLFLGLLTCGLTGKVVITSAG